MIKFCVDIAGPVRPRAAYALRLLLEAEGIVSAETSEPREADVVYSRTRPSAGGRDVVWIPAADADWDATEFKVSDIGGMPIVGDTPDSEHHDLLLAAYYFSTGVWERASARNAFGVPVARGSAMWDAGWLQQPVLNSIARTLRARLDRHVSRLDRDLDTIGRWPDGRRWAIALTHDVDRPLSKPPAAHYRKKLARAAARRDLSGFVRTSAGYLKNAVLSRDAGEDPEADPQFGFDGWMTAADGLGIRSAFYVAVRGSADEFGHPNDVYYDARLPAIRDALRRAVDRGFEVGLHASIACRDHVDLFGQEKAALSDILGGHPVVGNRHHYWALDSSAPTDTLRAHGLAGFTYDSSLGLNDAPGFRRGMAWPFYPFDPEASVEMGALQIPPTAMDAGLFYYEPGGAVERLASLRRHLDVVADAGGCAVLNWHLAQIVSDRMSGAGQALRGELEARRGGDPGIWWATPQEIADWWVHRRTRVFPRHAG